MRNRKSPERAKADNRTIDWMVAGWTLLAPVVFIVLALVT